MSETDKAPAAFAAGLLLGMASRAPSIERPQQSAVMSRRMTRPCLEVVSREDLEHVAAVLIEGYGIDHPCALACLERVKARMPRSTKDER